MTEHAERRQVRMGINVDPSEAEAIRAYARRRKMSVTAAVRTLLRTALDVHNSEQKEWAVKWIEPAKHTENSHSAKLTSTPRIQTFGSDEAGAWELYRHLRRLSAVANSTDLVYRPIPTEWTTVTDA